MQVAVVHKMDPGPYEIIVSDTLQPALQEQSYFLVQSQVVPLLSSVVGITKQEFRIIFIWLLLW